MGAGHSETYVNDENGNTLSGGNRANTSDSQNRLTRCDFNDGNSHYLNDYVYGPDGLRRQATVRGYAV